QLVRQREPLVEAPQLEAGRKPGHLVDDGLGLAPCDRFADRGGVEAVHHDRLCSERAERFRLCLARRRRDDVVAAGDQLWDEAAPDRTARSRNEHTHGSLLSAAQAASSRDGSCSSAGVDRRLPAPSRPTRPAARANPAPTSSARAKPCVTASAWLTFPAS